MFTSAAKRFVVYLVYVADVDMEHALPLRHTVSITRAQTRFWYDSEHIPMVDVVHENKS